MWAVLELLTSVWTVIWRAFTPHERRDGRRPEPADPYGWKKKDRQDKAE
jgi:hypothetical protein